jgi:hypothetical protein
MTEQAEERIPRPEEVLEHPDGYTPEQIPQPLPCSAGSSTGNPCPRPATVWIDRSIKWASCHEHARLFAESDELNWLGLAVAVATDWLKVAKAWRIEELESGVAQMLEGLREKLLRVESRADLLKEIADAPRNGDDRPNLTREQDEELRRLMRRSDELTNAFTTVEDVPEGQIREARRGRILSVLVEERERASEAVDRYKEELGLKD